MTISAIASASKFASVMAPLVTLIGYSAPPGAFEVHSTAPVPSIATIRLCSEALGRDA